MAKEYVYENSEDANEYKINWDKMEIYTQSTERDMNTSNAGIAVDHEIYCDYYGEQIGYLHFSEYHNVKAKDIHTSLPDKHYDKLLYINNILVNAEFRGWGIGSMIYDKFGEMYVEKFDHWLVAQVFVNPVAEYTYRREIEKSKIPSYAFNDELIVRDYDESEKQKVKELFNWLPKDQQNNFKKKIEDVKKEKQASISTSIDLRNLEFEDSLSPGIYSDSASIRALLNGSIVGSLSYEITDTLIEIGMIEVDEQFQNYGIGTALYKEFGKIYTERYSGWSIQRVFVNPVAEYAFRKAVSLGYIPESSISEDHIEREYTPERNELWQDLRGKLPENLRGPDKWALNKSSIEKISSSDMSTDLRNIEYDVIRYGAATKISVILNGMEIGYFKFFIDFNSTLYVDEIEVDEEYQNYGIGTALYKEFGRIYEEEYNGWPVGRFYVNPVAEYAFRKAVSLGWISETALNGNVKRHYTPQKNELWQDLRNKLPENLRGPERWALNNRENIKFADLETIDLRNLQFDVSIIPGKSNDEEAIGIQALLNGTKVGHLLFSVNNKDQYLYVNGVGVPNAYQNLGIGTVLYREFGKVYSERYNGWPVSRYYMNPIAEYAFRKAVSLGWVSENTLNGDVDRFYTDQHNQLWQDLRNKLPEDLRGPERWSGRN